MDPVMFSVKRAYWSANLRMIELTKPFGLTPARTDLMRIVAIHDAGGGVAQWKLVRLLGCCASVVSRMLRSLEDLDFVDRHSDRNDPRKKIVQLTKEGWVRLSKVITTLVDKGEIGLRVHQAWGRREDWSKKGGLFERLNGVRRVFWDRSPFLHPWRLDSVYDEEKDSPIIPEQRLQLDDVDATRPDEEALRDQMAKFAKLCMSSRLREQPRGRRRGDSTELDATENATENATEAAPPPSEGTLQRWTAHFEQLEPGSPVPPVSAFRGPPPALPPAADCEATEAVENATDTEPAPSEGTLQRWVAHVERLEPGSPIPPVSAFCRPPPLLPPAAASDAIEAAENATEAAPPPSEGTLRDSTAHVQRLEPGASIPPLNPFRRPPLLLPPAPSSSSTLE